MADLLQRVLRPLAGRRVPSHTLVPGDGSPVRSASGETTDTLELGLDDWPRPRRLRWRWRHRAPRSGLDQVLALATGRVGRVVDRLRQAERQAGDDESNASRSRRDRALLAAGHLAADLARLSGPHRRRGGLGGRWRPVPQPPGLAHRRGPAPGGAAVGRGDRRAHLGHRPAGAGPSGWDCPRASYDELDVGSPFDYRDHALLYVARSLPDRRRPESEPALHDELEALITAAGGRTLALFTSWRSMRAAVEALRDRLDVPVLAQSDLPKPALVEAFRDDEATCLFATLGFWQGVDVPGPHPEPGDRGPDPVPPSGRAGAARPGGSGPGPGAFRLVDLPRAGTLLAQGAGRLIRSASDRGVVAVLDSRLATAGYRGALLARVPPMKRTVDRAEVEAFLARITADA